MNGTVKRVLAVAVTAALALAAFDGFAPTIPAQAQQIQQLGDEEILGFWGKRPFLAKRIPRSKKPPEREPSEEPAMRLLPTVSSFTAPAQAEILSSWRTDPTLLRHSHP